MDKLHIKLTELSNRINNLINPNPRTTLLYFKIKYSFNNSEIKFDAEILDSSKNVYATFWSKGMFIHPSLVDPHTIEMVLKVLEESVDSWIAYGITNNQYLSLKDAQNAAKVILYNKYENNI